MKSDFYKKLYFYRILVQSFSFVFIVLVPFLVSIGARDITGNYYSFTIFGLEIVDPSMGLQTFLLSGNTLIIAVIIPILIALMFGRVFCSWVCPYTAMLDFIEDLFNKIFKRKLIEDKTNPKPALYWSILVVIILLTIIFTIPIFTFISFPGIISSNIYYLFIGLSLSIELYIVLVILILESYYSKRIWCKYICPVGSVLALFRTSNTMRITYERDQCDCLGTISPCKISCPQGLDPKGKNLYPYCYNCGKCVKVCEKTGKGALKFRFKKNKFN